MTLRVRHPDEATPRTVQDRDLVVDDGMTEPDCHFRADFAQARAAGARQAGNVGQPGNWNGDHS